MAGSTAADHTGPIPLGQVWFNARQAGIYLGIHWKTVRQLHLAGRLKGARTAAQTPGSHGRVSFKREWLDAYKLGVQPEELQPLEVSRAQSA